MPWRLSLDGTYIDVQTPLLDKPRYRNRKGGISVNVLGVVYRNIDFVYMLLGWEGSAADGRVLRDAVSRPDGLKVPNGQYYLCDNGYMNYPGFLAPYRSVRYHLDEWCEGSRAPQNAKELYNQRHTKARNVIERTWGIMKWRWAVLRSTSFYPLRTQNQMILSCALLHNFIRREMEVDPTEAHVPDLDPNHRNLYANDEPVEDEFVESVGSNYEWSAWRDNLTNDMFTEWSVGR
ncbi:hypothetical protein BUALT_Bualt12G0125600 [Buddleja alternifolia]|uniref:DDE Tnp4 domain-containing protein n=1 Tax=Buddleja alternifolia TaxID=168488 RepID=A0AAV6WPP4_9LAMI|nr:hypothetical protein BUALT_Bualt12G0125600 [Buddleja alternifolia]